jgi:hypothetical protein
MQIPPLAQLIPILQTSIGPVILISGVGLLLLSMTNRLGRVIDRARSLVREQYNADEIFQVAIRSELGILWKRARLIRLAIVLSSMSALAAAILIITLFVTALWQVESGLVVGFLFITCMLCLIGSLVVFIHDLNQSLAALKLELEGRLN